MTQSSSLGRYLAALMVVLAGTLVCVLAFAGPGHAQTVGVSYGYVTSQSGPDQVPETRFPSGTQTIYFDYNVAVPSSTDVGEVDIIVGGTSGPSIASTTLDLHTAGPKFVPVTPNSGTFPDGGYCAILLIDGIPQTLPNSVPYAFRVGQADYTFSCQNPPVGTGTPTTPAATGTATVAGTTTPTATATLLPTSTPVPTNTSTPTSTPVTPPPPPVTQPTATDTPTITPTPTPTTTPTLLPTQIVQESPRHFILAITNTLHSRRFGILRLYVHGTHGKAVSGVNVAVDGRRLGLRQVRRGRTNAYGIVTFSSIWPPHGGTLSITGTKSGYASAIVELVVP